MNVSQRKEYSKLSGFINNFRKKLMFKKYDVQLLGTASMESQYYASDYDFFTNISEVKLMKTVFSELNRITSLKDINVFFMEFKIQYMNGEKEKYYDLPFALDKDMDRESIEYFKIDWIIYDDYQFTDVSIIYNLNKVIKPKEEVIKLIAKDMFDFYKEGKIYKSLKRFFSICNLINDYKTMVNLSKLFNSEYGKMYKIASNLGTIQAVKAKYPSRTLNKKINANLRYFNLPLMNDKQIEDTIQQYSRAFNNEALKYYKGLNTSSKKYNLFSEFK